MITKHTRTDYKICPDCGASLDVGETCDCKKKPVNRIQGCIFYVTHSCKECIYNSDPLTSIGNCTILKQR